MIYWSEGFLSKNEDHQLEMLEFLENEKYMNPSGML